VSDSIKITLLRDLLCGFQLFLTIVGHLRQNINKQIEFFFHRMGSMTNMTNKMR